MPTPVQTLLLGRPISFGNLTRSGNEITDYTRSLPDQGDGLTNDDSFGIWPAATNRAINSNAKTNITSISDVLATTSRVATGLVGADTTHFSTVTANGATAEGTSQLISGGAGSTQYTYSVWLAGTGTVKLYISDTVSGKQLGAQITLTATPTKYSVTATTGIAGITVTCGWETDAQQALTVTHGRWMCETGPIATPHILTDGGTAARSAGRVQLPIAGLFTATQGWIAVRIRNGPVASADMVAAGLYPTYWAWETGSGDDRYSVYRSGSSGVFEKHVAAANVNATQASTIAALAYSTVIAKWGATSHALSIDGAAFSAGTVTGAGTPLDAIALSDIGEDPQSGAPISEITGEALWFAAGSGTLTNSDAAAIHALGNAGPPRFGALPGNPTAIWAAKTGSFQRRRAS